MKLNGFKTGLIFGLLSDVLFFLFFILIPLVAPLEPSSQTTTGVDPNFVLWFLGYIVFQPLLTGFVGKWLIKVKQ